jgi:hypothetical protein
VLLSLSLSFPWSQAATERGGDDQNLSYHNSRKSRSTLFPVSIYVGDECSSQTRRTENDKCACMHADVARTKQSDPCCVVGVMENIGRIGFTVSNKTIQ